MVTVRKILSKVRLKKRKREKDGGDYESGTSPLKWSGEARQLERRRDATIFRKFILTK